MLALAALLLIQGAEAVLPLVVEGNKFYQLQEDYTQPAESFTIFGVDYQPGGSSSFNIGASDDVLTDVVACQRDAYLLNKLGANAIRVYSVSPWLNHDECMTIFNDAGIYVLLDVNTPDSSLNRYDPESTYHYYYMNNVFGLVDAFKEYPNLMGFIAGNEIINDDKSASVDPVYIRAVIRDVKEYVAQWSNRTIPVGYAAADVLEYRDITWEYLQCNANTGNSTVDADSRADFFGINSYTWCSGVNDFQSSGYQDIIDTFNTSSIPIIFTEYGCNAKLPRTFDEVDGGVYGPLKDFVSGGFVYEYSNEASNYGLVTIEDDGNVSLLSDYDNLQTAFAKVNTTRTTPPSSVTGTATLSNVPTCKSDMTSTHSFNWNFTLPPCPVPYMIQSNGGNKNIGSLVSVPNYSFNYTVVDAQGSTITPTLTYDSAYGINYQTNVPESILDRPVRGSDSSSTASSTTSSTLSSTSSATLGSTGSASSAKSSAPSGNSGAKGASGTATSNKKNSAPKAAISWLGALTILIAALL